MTTKPKYAGEIAKLLYLNVQICIVEAITARPTEAIEKWVAQKEKKGGKNTIEQFCVADLDKWLKKGSPDQQLRIWQCGDLMKRMMTGDEFGSEMDKIRIGFDEVVQRTKALAGTGFGESSFKAGEFWRDYTKKKIPDQAVRDELIRCLNVDFLTKLLGFNSVVDGWVFFQVVVAQELRRHDGEEVEDIVAELLRERIPELDDYLTDQEHGADLLNYVMVNLGMSDEMLKLIGFGGGEGGSLGSLYDDYPDAVRRLRTYFEPIQKVFV